MLASDAQLLSGLRDGLTVEQIADDLGFEVTAVKARLMQISPEFRRMCRQEQRTEKWQDAPEHNFTESQLDMVNQIVIDTAVGATLPDGTPDHRTRLKAAMYVRDDIKGRLNPVKALANGPTFNLIEFNNMIAQSRQLSNTAKTALAPATGTENIVEAEEVQMP